MWEEEFDTQLRKIVTDVSLPVSWGQKWLSWIERDRIQEELDSKQTIATLEINITNLEKKLNKLLDAYLEGVVEEKDYKEKKNILVEEKIKLQEKLTDLKVKGIESVEPFEEFVKTAINSRKFAREKNNFVDLAVHSRNVVSNLFLSDQRLSPTYKKGFDTLFSAIRQSRLANSQSQNSFCVEMEGIEPSSEKLFAKLLQA